MAFSRELDASQQKKVALLQQRAAEQVGSRDCEWCQTHGYREHGSAIVGECSAVQAIDARRQHACPSKDTVHLHAMVHNLH